jgi:hypothetical protein
VRLVDEMMQHNKAYRHPAQSIKLGDSSQRTIPFLQNLDLLPILAPNFPLMSVR